VSLADRSAVVRWGMALLPLVALAALLLVIVRLDPAGKLRGDVPPVEKLAFERVTLDDGGITVRVLNDGPDAVSIAQVMVDDAYWSFTQEPAGKLGHLGAATLRIPYPWVEGETHALRLISRNGITFDHTIEVAVETPRPGGRLFGIFALIGLYVGVLPVAIGLLWYPLLKRLGRRGLDFVLGGWQLTGIHVVQSGLALTATLGGSTVLNLGGERRARPNLVGNPELPEDQRTVARWFNTDAFAAFSPSPQANRGGSRPMAPSGDTPDSKASPRSSFAAPPRRAPRRRSRRPCRAPAPARRRAAAP